MSDNPSEDKTLLPPNYTIPKRKHEEIEPEQPSEATQNATDQAAVLAAAYAAYAAQGYQTGDFYGQWCGQYVYDPSYYAGQNTVGLTTSYNHLQPGFYNMQQYVGAQPKAKVSTTYGQYIVNCENDASLPKELTQLFQPLYCKLCSTQLSSSVMAKLHYRGKNHEKKIRKWLTEYSERTGEPLHKRAKVVPKRPEPTTLNDNDPKYFHCDVCDLPLTGRLHAESHYMGKNHQRVLAGKKAPAGKGYYDSSGKWIRTTPAKSDPTGRDGFGQDFIVSKQPTTSTNVAEQPTTTTATSLRCDICNVSVTSLQQIEMHYNGQKHKKKLKAMGLDGANGNGAFGGGEIIPKDNILSSVVQEQESLKDLSVFRTPSGFYYCNPCNLSVNSEIQFRQHLGSKNHHKKISSNKE